MIEDKCRLCQQQLTDEPLISYQKMPASAQSLPLETELEQDIAIDMSLYQCLACGLVQHTLPPVEYYRSVIRATGVSGEMTAYRHQQFSEWITQYNLQGKKLLEIGCGKGEFIDIMSAQPVEVHGVEFEVDSVETCHRKGQHVTRMFMDDSVSLEDGPYDGFYVLNFLEHIPDLKSFLLGISNNLKEGAVGLVEVPNFDMILQAGLFSEVIRDHIHYFTQQSLRNTMETNGFEIVSLDVIWQDYIISAVVRKRERYDLSAFLKMRSALKLQLDEYIKRFPQGQVAVWGAGHQSLAILSLAALAGKIAYVVDSAEFKQNHYTPASHIPIVSPTFLKEKPVEAVIVIAGSYSAEVVNILLRDYASGMNIAVIEPNGLVSVVSDNDK